MDSFQQRLTQLDKEREQLMKTLKIYEKQKEELKQWKEKHTELESTNLLLTKQKRDIEVQRENAIKTNETLLKQNQSLLVFSPFFKIQNNLFSIIDINIGRDINRESVS